MAITNTIKAGYRLTVKSWENDGDYHNTVQKDGLSLEKVKFIVDILCSYENNNLGNIYQPTKDERKAEIATIREVVKKYDNIEKILGLRGVPETDEHFVSCIHECVLYEYMGGGDFYIRNLESYKVEYIPVEIKIEDVTSTLFKL